MAEGEKGVIVGVQEHSAPFLRFLNKQELVLGAVVKIIEFFEFDGSIKILLNEKKEITVSNKVSQNLFIKKS
jgi:DtxR family Mn-dependent transcriptional regulator